MTEGKTEGMTLVTERKTLVTKGKTLVMEGKTLVMEVKILVTEGKTLVTEGKTNQNFSETKKLSAGARIEGPVGPRNSSINIFVQYKTPKNQD